MNRNFKLAPASSGRSVMFTAIATPDPRNLRSIDSAPFLWRSLPILYFVAIGGLLFAASGVFGAEDRHVARETLSTAIALSFVEDTVLGTQDIFGKVQDCAINSNGEILVLDRGYVCIHRFSEDGAYLGRFGGEGEGPGDMRNPSALAIGPNDEIYVAGLSARVVIYDAEGVPLGDFTRTKETIPSRVLSVDLDSYGNIYVCSVDIINQTSITKYEPAKYSAVAAFGDTYAVGHDVDTRAERTFGGGFVKVLDGGKLLYTQYTPPEVRIYSTEGELLKVVDTRARGAELPKVVIDKGRITFYSPKFAAGRSLLLDQGAIMTSVRERFVIDGQDMPNAGVIYCDLFDQEWRHLGTKELPLGDALLCSDKQSRIYIMESREYGDREMPVIVRYRYQQEASRWR